ncbi:MAG: TldD protein, partial [Candidatus Omnitrophica bacterium CG11_big_fil_rev_8_21_14_0_20_64_10]
NLDLKGTAQRAFQFCRLNRNPEDLKPGKFAVLLEPEAVAELMEWLSFTAFGARSLENRSSFLTDQMGKQVVGTNISIWDDGTDPAGLRVPFDPEGTPKRPVPLIEKGVARGVVSDHHYAKFSGGKSTGHALPYDDAEGGPAPAHLFLAPGKTPAKEMLQTLDRGLWIARFHYVNGFLNPKTALMTGLTRDGTFQVKNGKVTGAVKNLRFTQSVVESLLKVVALSKERRLVADPAHGFAGVTCPAMILRDFTFTGQTA